MIINKRMNDKVRVRNKSLWKVNRHFRNDLFVVISVSVYEVHELILIPWKNVPEFQRNVKIGKHTLI